MDPDIKNNPDDLLTICLVNYYKSEENVRVFDTLSLEFKDRAILNVGVLLIEKKNDIVEFEDFKDIVRRMNKI
uniref:Uncharacterized protein n=1 Tax=Romanomermis culicivorax TaxID=13658 RepID=A0A915K6C8_ROMCU